MSTRATVALRPATMDTPERETTTGTHADGEPRPSRDYGTDGRCPCGAPLSRYNPHTVCVACIATNRRAPSPRPLALRQEVTAN